MIRTKTIIIRKKTEDGSPCKVEALAIKKDNGVILLLITNLFLNEIEYPHSETLKVFKGKYLQADTISFRLETFYELIKKLNEL